MRINQNIAAFNAYNNLNNTQNRLSGSLEKLSSGFRINRAADDASGLVNSENLRSQIGGLKVATRNAQDAISLVQTAEGAQTEVHSILQRMRDLAVEAGNTGTNDTVSLQANQAEIEELQSELDRINDDTQFGTIKVFTQFQGTDAEDATAAEATGIPTMAEFDNDGAPSFTIDTGGGEQTVEITDVLSSDTDTDGLADAIQAVFDGNGDITGVEAVAIDTNDDGTNDGIAIRTTGTGENESFELAGGVGDFGLTADTYEGAAAVEEAGGAIFQIGANEGQTEMVRIDGVSTEALEVDAIDVTTDAGAAITAIDSAIADVSSNRADLGAFQNRMESLTRNLGVAVENLSAAESRIRDTDMAMEMVEFTRNQIMSQAGTAMLAQANVVPQSVLSLLG